MSSVIPVPVRRFIVERHLKGESLRSIANELCLSVSGVRKIWRRYRDHGDAGLIIGYGQSGRRGLRSDRLIYRCAVWLKRRHPGWGAVLIHLKLKERYPKREIPHPRTFQRWFRQLQLNYREVRKPIVESAKAEAVHEVWQLDATSHQRLADDTPASWVTLVDEYSGGMLQSVVFPPVCL